MGAYLHLVEHHPPDYGGGAAIYNQEITRYLATRGHDVRVLAVHKAPGEPYTVQTDHDGPVQIDRVNLPYFTTHDPEGWELGLSGWRQHQRRVVAIIDDLFRDWTPDLVQYNTSRPLGEECLPALHRRGVPIVALLHEAWTFCPRLMLLHSPTGQPCGGPSPAKCAFCLYSHYDGWLRAAVKLPWRVLRWRAYLAYRLWRRTVARRCIAGAMAYSQFMARVAAPHVAGPVRYIPLGINLGGLPDKQPVRPRQPLRFGFIGGAQPNKGIDLVLTAVDSLKRDGLVAEFHVWGPGQDQVAEAARRHDVADLVRLRGSYTAEQLWDVYGEIDIALMATTVSEPFGRVPQEAAAAGIPTIAPAVGGLTEQIRDGIDGLLFRFRDAADLERQMRRVLTEPGLYKQLQGNVRRPPDTRQQVALIEDFYREILDRHRRKAGRKP